jgi:L-alanine-DL-glutamate epimerase-like enolase superfamily enzyme
VAQRTDIRIVDLTCEFEALPFRAPLKFGGRVVEASELINVRATVETVDGRRAQGAGSMPVGNVWGWPSAKVEPAQTAEAVRRTARALVEAARGYRDAGHPLDVMVALEHGYRAVADGVTAAMGLPERMPTLMILVAASPLDAAVHDGYGKVHGVNVYNAYGREFVRRDLAAFLTPEFAGEYLDRYTLRTPKPTMPLYHLVGALDPLTPAEVAKPIGDGLPETLGEWIAADGLTHMKIKLNGEDLGWDVARVAAVERVAVEAQAGLGRKQWNYSLDFNEKCKSVDYVLEFLRRLSEAAPAALGRVQYIEQPTARDLKAHPENRMHAAAKIKPVVIDESLVDLETLQLAIEQGYSGVALKACKGQTQALLAGAYARKHKLFLCVQDLTCPGMSFLQSAGIAARLPTIAAVEGNGRQYCPAGNRPWADRFPTLFKVKDGTVETGRLTGPGLGY